MHSTLFNTSFNVTLVVVVVILFPTEYKQWKTEYISNITTTININDPIGSHQRSQRLIGLATNIIPHITGTLINTFVAIYQEGLKVLVLYNLSSKKICRGNIANYIAHINVHLPWAPQIAEILNQNVTLYLRLPCTAGDDVDPWSKAICNYSNSGNGMELTPNDTYVSRMQHVQSWEFVTRWSTASRISFKMPLPLRKWDLIFRLNFFLQTDTILIERDVHICRFIYCPLSCDTH